jgi:hypothetical protein
LFITTSTFPKAAMACSAAVRTLLNIGHIKPEDLMLSWEISSVSFSGVRLEAATFQPCFAKWSAVSLPRPLLVPVMKIVFVISDMSLLRMEVK